MTTDGDLIQAIYTRLQELDNCVVLLGEPSAVQSVPLVYLMAFQTDYRRSQGREVVDMRPRIRCVVRWQDAPNAETELLTMQAQIHDLLSDWPTMPACTVTWEQTLYGYLTVAGTRYRMAQMQPRVLTM